MKQVKPILHARDHGCGGADPLPGYCILLDDVATLKALLFGVGDYHSEQEGVFTIDTIGDTGPHDITNWPFITVPLEDQVVARAAGKGLYARWTADSIWTGGVSTNTIDDHIHDEPVSGATWTTLAAEGFIWSPGTGGATADVNVWMHLLGGGSAEDLSQVKNGVLDMWWLDGSAPVPAGPGLWTGSYPIVDADIADGADIDPAKLDHPGTTTDFLRGDGNWSNLVLEVEY